MLNTLAFAGMVDLGIVFVKFCLWFLWFLRLESIPLLWRAALPRRLVGWAAVLRHKQPRRRQRLHMWQLIRQQQRIRTTHQQRSGPEAAVQHLSGMGTRYSGSMPDVHVVATASRPAPPPAVISENTDTTVVAGDIGAEPCPYRTAFCLCQLSLYGGELFASLGLVAALWDACRLLTALLLLAYAVLLVQREWIIRRPPASTECTCAHCVAQRTKGGPDSSQPPPEGAAAASGGQAPRAAGSPAAGSQQDSAPGPSRQRPRTTQPRARGELPQRTSQDSAGDQPPSHPVEGQHAEEPAPIATAATVQRLWQTLLAVLLVSGSDNEPGVGTTEVAGSALLSRQQEHHLCTSLPAQDASSTSAPISTQLTPSAAWAVSDASPGTATAAASLTDHTADAPAAGDERAPASLPQHELAARELIR
jgi:hypothetical protein